MINIQFMTEDQSFIDKRGDKVYRPDYDKLIANACCEEEVKAIERCRETMDKLGTGFTFAIVYTDCTHTIEQDIHEKGMPIRSVYKWSVMQHPWYTNGYRFDGTDISGRVSKQEMIESISHIYMETKEVR